MGSSNSKRKEIKTQQEFNTRINSGSRKEVVLPLPEALGEHGTGYRINASSGSGSRRYGGHASSAQKRMMVPLDNVPKARRTRVHETAHVAFSPPKPEPDQQHKLTFLQACEDMRMNKLCEEAGVFDHKTPFFDSSDSKQELRLTLAEYGSQPIRMGYMVAGYGTGDFEEIDEILKDNLSVLGKKKLDQALEKVKEMIWEKENPTHEDARKAAAYLTQEFADNDNAYDEDNDHYGQVWTPGYELEPTDVITPHHDADYIEQRAEQAEEDLRLRGGGHYEINDPRAKWGSMSIDRPALTHDITESKEFSLTRKSATDQGAIPRRLHRYTIDSQIFVRRRKEITGAVLIDVSGSMHLDSDDVVKIMEALPASIIATYAGTRSANGVLRIIAENGKHCSKSLMDLEELNGNIIDGPALRWLGEHEKSPKIWVSDGKVTGIDERVSGTFHLECKQIMRRYKIKRVPSLAELRQRLTGTGYEG